MTLSPVPESMSDHHLAVDIARLAGALLLQTRKTMVADGLDEMTLRSRGDSLSNELILRLLAEHRSRDAVLSEESKDDLARLREERVWIIDPLDGTREYAEGRSDWAVHVALVVGGTPRAAAVGLPDRAVVLSTAEVPPLPSKSPGRVRLLVSRTRPTPLADHLARELDAELVAMGSAGAKAMAVVLGEGDVYAHSGGQYEWDSAAPVGVASSAGLHTSRLDGAPLIYNRADPYLPDLLVCRPELAPAVLSAVGRSGWSNSSD